MTHAATLLALALACNNAGPGRTDDEVAQHLALALTSHGNRPDPDPDVRKLAAELAP